MGTDEYTISPKIRYDLRVNPQSMDQENAMEYRTLGRTGLEVSRLGLGLSEIRVYSPSQPEGAAKVLNTALDAGINFLDTAACYGTSEEVLGATIAGRRDEYVLATKAGHSVGDWDGPEWTAETVTHSIERSLKRLRTDRLDLVQLHSCGVDILEKGDVIEALQAAQKAGKTRFIGYSGDNEAAKWAVDSGHFDTLQTSFNLVDQNAATKLFEGAKAQNMGIIIKRPIANAAWGAEKSPSGYAEEYFRRAQRMQESGAVAGAPDDRIKLALGFVFSHEAVDTAIVGTSNADHMASNIRMLEAGVELPQETLDDLHERFAELDMEKRQRG